MVLFKYTKRQIGRVGNCHPTVDSDKAGRTNNMTVLSGRVFKNYKMPLGLCLRTVLLRAERTLHGTVINIHGIRDSRQEKPFSSTEDQSHPLVPLPSDGGFVLAEKRPCTWKSSQKALLIRKGKPL